MRLRRDIGRHCAMRAVLLAVAITTSAAVPAAAADLDVDADRSGAITAADEGGETHADVQSGALVLPNVDDDGGRCAGDLRALTRRRFLIDRLFACHDGLSAAIDGPDDEQDMAVLQIAPDEVASATVTLVAGAGHGRLHGGSQNGRELRVDPAAVRAGTRVLLEATDVARDSSWEGVLRVRLSTVAPDGTSTTDEVALRVAPLVFAPQTAPVVRWFIASPTPPDRVRAKVRSTVRQLERSRREGTLPPAFAAFARPASRWRRYLRAFAVDERGFLGGAATVGRRLRRWTGPATRIGGAQDGWLQDRFESAVASVPWAGRVRTVRVAVVNGRRHERVPVRARNPAAAPYIELLREFRGPNRGALWGVVPAATPPADAGRFAFDASGAFEATPPVPGAPLGKVLLANADAKSGTFALAARQAQPVVGLPNPRIGARHVDDVVAFVPTTTTRGWVAVLPDPRGALRLLAGAPNGRVATGSRLLSMSVRAARSAASRRANRAVARHIDSVEAVLRRELGLAGSDIVRVPVLYAAEPTGPTGGGFQPVTPNLVNGIVTGRRTFVMPHPEVPGRGGDPFAAAARQALRAVGVRAQFVDANPFPHVRGGHLHCVTNTERLPPVP